MAVTITDSRRTANLDDGQCQLSQALTHTAHHISIFSSNSLKLDKHRWNQRVFLLFRHQQLHKGKSELEGCSWSAACDQFTINHNSILTIAVTCTYYQQQSDIKLERYVGLVLTHYAKNLSRGDTPVLPLNEGGEELREGDMMERQGKEVKGG